VPSALEVRGWQATNGVFDGLCNQYDPSGSATLEVRPAWLESGQLFEQI
jgi:hypothetical protein